MPITKQKIQGALRKAGFEASKSSTTAVKGWRNYSNGYKTSDDDTHIYVHYIQGSHFMSVESRRKYDAIHIDRFAVALESFKPEKETDRYGYSTLKIAKDQ